MKHKFSPWSNLPLQTNVDEEWAVFIKYTHIFHKLDCLTVTELIYIQVSYWAMTLVLVGRMSRFTFPPSSVFKNAISSRMSTSVVLLRFIRTECIYISTHYLKILYMIGINKHHFINVQEISVKYSVIIFFISRFKKKSFISDSCI